MLTLRGQAPDKISSCIETIRILLFCLKRFSFELREVNNERFVEVIDNLQRELSSEPWNAGAYNKAVHACKAMSLLQSKREQEYLAERDQEFRKIVLTLTNQLRGLVSGATQFEDQVEHYADKLDELSNLEDIRKIREQLSDQVSSIRQEVARQRSRKEVDVEAMKAEIQRLNFDLREAIDKSLTDPLTGVANRDGLDTFLGKLVERGVLEDGQFAVLMWDVDNFKRLNDTYGHKAGDAVLKALSKQCVKMTRNTDMVARYGGEEFVIVLNGVSRSLALKRGRQIVRSIAGIDLLLTVSGQVNRVRTTVSMGVAQFRPGDTKEALIERADQALYRAKRSGKNRAELEAD